MPAELKITYKDEERRYTKKFLIYEEVKLDVADDVIQRCLEEVRREFGREPVDVKIQAEILI